MNFTSDSIGGKYFPSFFILLGYFLTAFGEIILVKILKKKKKMMMSWEPPAIVEVDEGRNAAAATVAVEEESVITRVAAVGVAVLIIIGLAINSFHEGIEIGQQKRAIYAWRLLWPISMNHVLLAISLGIVALRMQPRRPFLTLVAYSFAFAISSPIGILIALSKDDDFLVDYDLLRGIFSGVFLYVSINHLITKGFNPQEAQWSYGNSFRNFWAVILVIGLGLFGAVVSGFL